MACSTDATAWFESFLEPSCLETTNSVGLDPLGGLRLDTNGTPAPAKWDTSAELSSGTALFNSPIGVSSLAVSDGGDGLNGDDPGALQLPNTSLAVTRDASPVLGPNPSLELDNDSVDDPAVVKVGAQYFMFYAGYAEDGGPSRIFRATSSNGTTWTKYDSGDAGTAPDPVLDGLNTAGTFDNRGVYGPEVVYDSAAPAASRYKMWYSARGDVFGSIGYATSADGITWTEVDGVPVVAGNPDPDIDPVLDHGRPGAPDSFSAGDPSIIRDAGVWKMWYTGDDSDLKRIAYATSADGITWTKGGMVIDVDNDHSEYGSFAPSVWKTGTTYNIQFVGRKNVGTNLVPDFQTKIRNASSSDGLEWTGFGIALTTGGAGVENLNSPEVFPDSGGNKVYFSGNQEDGGAFQIGLDGTGPVIVGLGTRGTRFDSRSAGGPSPVEVSEVTVGEDEFIAAYEGRRGSDDRPRIGLATWDGAEDWDKIDGAQSDASLFPDGQTNQFDESGQSDPALYFESGAYHLFFTGTETTNQGDVMSIGRVQTTQGAGTNLPAAWPNPDDSHQILLPSGTATAFDEVGVSDPYVVKEPGGDYVLFYVGHAANGVLSIGRAVSTTGITGTFTSRNQALAPQAGTFEKDGIKNPVVWLDSGTWHMIYTGVERFDENADGVVDKVYERIGHATTDDPSSGTWVRDTLGALLLGPSQSGYAPDEDGGGATGVVRPATGTVTHLWYGGLERAGRRYGLRAQHDSAATTPGHIPNGFASYQFGDGSGSARDFQSIVRDATAYGGTVELWMSVLQPLTADPRWSDYFPVAVDADDTELLDLLLTIEAVRWQARLTRGTDSPVLDKVVINHADIVFEPTGDSRTVAIDGPVDQTITSWDEVTVTTALAGTGAGATGTVKVLNGSTNTLLQTQSLTIGTAGNPATTTFSIAGIPVAANPSLKLLFELSAVPGTRTGSPLVTSAKVSYLTNVSASEQPPPPPPPPPPPDQDGDGVPDATDQCPTVAAATANGCPPNDVTIAANPALVVFGSPTTLSGKVTQAGAPVPNLAVSVLQQPFGTPAFAAMTSATTNPTGDWSTTTTPQSNTTYKATVPNGSSEPTASVQVAQKMAFRASRRGTKGSFSGTIQPAHPNREVVIQRKSGTSYVTFKKVRTSSTSSFATTAKLAACRKYTFRVITAADADHAAGQSADVLVEKHRVALKVSVRGRKVTFTGKVGPLHRSGSVLIRRIVGTRAAKFATAKLTRKSTFRLVKTVRKGRYVFRADKASDRCHFAGKSARRSARVR